MCDTFLSFCLIVGMRINISGVASLPCIAGLFMIKILGYAGRAFFSFLYLKVPSDLAPVIPTCYKQVGSKNSRAVCFMSLFPLFPLLIYFFWCVRYVWFP